MGSLLLTASWWNGVSDFHWQAAAIVGGIVVAVTVVVLVAAIAWPAVPIVTVGIASLTSKVVAVATIALITGLVAAAAAGIHWGHEAQLKRQEQIESIKQVSNQLDIYFAPAPGAPNRAADFECTLVVYEETELASRVPTITTKHTKVAAVSSEEFYRQVDHQLNKWFGKRVEGDKDGKPRRVVIYMHPYPGDGIYERLKHLSQQHGTCVVNRVEGQWTSALPK
jgi:hypothetical protein